MSIILDGSPVQLGDTLYSRRAGASGTVVQTLDTAVILRINRGGGPRDYTVVGNGLIAGQKDVYWHPSIDIALGKGEGAKFQKIQTLVTKLLEVL